MTDEERAMLKELRADIVSLQLRLEQFTKVVVYAQDGYAFGDKVAEALRRRNELSEEDQLEVVRVVVAHTNEGMSFPKTHAGLERVD